MKELKEQIAILKRGTVEIYLENELLQKLKKSHQTKKPLRVKLGVDPTAPDIHLGHTVALRKLRQFQDLGHTAVLIIGDYTALIGDPSGVEKTRPQLSPEQVKQNSQTYLDQVTKILDKKRLEIRHNSEWFKKMTFQEILKLASRMTVARLLERDDFQKRYQNKQPISLHEFFYPLMQGYDSIMVDADIELGGTDQIFNLLVGRNLLKEEGKEPQIAMTLPLIEGTDGTLKMSKSYGNTIGVNDSPNDMFGKIMSINDELMWKYFEIFSHKSESELIQLKDNVQSGKLNPRDAKVELAKEIITWLHNPKAAQEASENFKRVFTNKETPQDIPQYQWKKTEGKIWLVRLLTETGLVKSSMEAKRLILQGAVSIDGERIRDENYELTTKGEILLKVGKRKFLKVLFKT